MVHLGCTRMFWLLGIHIRASPPVLLACGLSTVEPSEGSGEPQNLPQHRIARMNELPAGGRQVGELAALAVGMGARCG